jgi:anti-sigma-K factor RskA
MSTLQDLFDEAPEEWLAALPRYQRLRVDALLAQEGDFEEAAEKWLTARPEHTAPFGATRQPTIFKEKLWEEIEKFLCGDAAYAAEREKLAQQRPIVHSYVVAVISAAIAPVLGASGVFLAPAVVLLLATIGTVSLNTWCSARKEMRDQADGAV